MYDINKIVISIITADFLQDLPLAGLNIYYSHQNYSHPGSTVQNKQEDIQKHTQYKTRSFSLSQETPTFTRTWK